MIQSSEFIKSLNFGIHLKKKNLIFFISYLKINLYRYNIYIFFDREYCDRSELDLSDETIEIKNFHFNLKLWWKNCWKLSNLLHYRKAHSFQTIKGIDTKYWYHRLKTWLKIVNFRNYEFLIMNLWFSIYTIREINRQRTLRSGRPDSLSEMIQLVLKWSMFWNVCKNNFLIFQNYSFNKIFI